MRAVTHQTFYMLDTVTLSAGQICAHVPVRKGHGDISLSEVREETVYKTPHPHSECHICCITWIIYIHTSCHMYHLPMMGGGA